MAQPNQKDDANCAAGAPPRDYEAALAELEGLVTHMEGGGLSLEASLAAYQRGAVLVAYCRQQLEKMEQQVRVLDGEMLKPFEVNDIQDGEASH